MNELISLLALKLTSRKRIAGNADVALKYKLQHGETASIRPKAYYKNLMSLQLLTFFNRHDVWRTTLVSTRSLIRHSLLIPCREQDKEATVYIGNLDERVTDSLVWELMLQAGRIVNVHLPKDRVTQTHQGYGFVEFISEEDAEYAARIMNQVRLYGKPIRVNKASADKQKTVEVGAELFVGNLDPMVTEQTLYDTFGRFGSLISAPKVTPTNDNM